MACEEHWENAHAFKACVHSWAEQIGVHPARVQIQRMSHKWASCSPRGVISFNRDLLDQPRQVGEAVSVHELVHPKVPNHGPVFKSLMRVYLAERGTGMIPLDSCSYREAAH
jgi:predicted metal-dependent hydrolase